MKTRVYLKVMLRDGILDPQGKTIEDNLPSLGFGGVSGVRIGKHIEFEIEGATEAAVRAQVEAMSEKLLSNPVIEDFSYHLQS